MKLELKIVDILARNQEKKFTINEIAKSLKEHYSFVHRIVNRLTNDRVIHKEKVGNSFICSLNKNSEKTRALLQLSEVEKKDEFYNANKGLKLILEDLVKSLSEGGNAISIILFGSYAKGTAAKESDIDILLIGKKNKRIEKIAKEMYAKYGKEINIITMTSDNIKNQRDKIIMKEIISNHIILRGVERFVAVILK